MQKIYRFSRDVWLLVVFCTLLGGLYRWTHAYPVQLGVKPAPSLTKTAPQPVQHPSTTQPAVQKSKPSHTSQQAATIPSYVLTTLTYVRSHHRAPDGYEGGRTFTNYQRVVPYADSRGKRISYQERDVHPHVPGVNRGAERLVTSQSDAYYTADHYRTFIHIAE